MKESEGRSVALCYYMCVQRHSKIEISKVWKKIILPKNQKSMEKIREAKFIGI